MRYAMTTAQWYKILFEVPSLIPYFRAITFSRDIYLRSSFTFFSQMSDARNYEFCLIKNFFTFCVGSKKSLLNEYEL